VRKGDRERRGYEHRYIRGMSAQPQDIRDPDDPVEILAVLPKRCHAQFRAEYLAAAQAAQRPEGYGELHTLLRQWRLRALAYSDPGYEVRKEAARTGAGTWVPAREVIAGWDELVAASQHRPAE
jgi:hypothetical protein